MIGFPFDSHVTYESDGTPVYDRAINSDAYRKLLKELFTNGVNKADATNLQVISSNEEGMSVVVLKGFAMIEGVLAKEDARRTIVFEASDSLDRIDTVVVRLNTNDNARNVDLYVSKGTPATDPVPPELNRSGSIYELGLANVFIAKNTTSISQQRITDTRADVDRCGWINAIDKIDSNVFTSMVDGLVKELRDLIDTETAGHLQNQIDVLKGTEVAMDLNASGWVGNTYTISNSRVTASSNQELMPAITITAEQLEALQGANIIDSGQGDGYMMIRAMGDVPTLTIPIRVIFH